MDKRAASEAGAAPAPVSARAVRMAHTQWLLGLAAVGLGLLLHACGLGGRAEFAAFDLKTKMFCATAPGLSDQIVVVAIDDPTLETVLGWPMNRELLGRAFLELERAGASVIAVDLLFDERGHGGLEADAALARAVEVRKRTVLAASFQTTEDSSGSAVEDGPRLKARSVPLDVVLEAVHADPAVEERTLRLRVLPGSLDSGAEADAFHRAFVAAAALREVFAGTSAPASSADPGACWPRALSMTPPVPELARASGRLATVNFGGGDTDGSVRRIPLWVEFRDRLFPSLGLHAALLHMGIPLASVRAERDATTFARPDGSVIEIPTYLASLRDPGTDGGVGGVVTVTWPRGGFAGWQSQFVIEGSAPPDNEAILSLGRVLDPIVTSGPAIQRNIALIDKAMEIAGKIGLVPDPNAYAAQARAVAAVTPLDDGWPALYRAQRAAWNRTIAEANGLLGRATEGVDRQTLTDAERSDIEALEAIAHGCAAPLAEIDAGIERIRFWREDHLPRRVRGRICFVGWTATGAIADNVATAVDSRTPGVLVHAAVANSILKQPERWTILAPASWWGGWLTVVVLGVIGAGIGVRVPVAPSPLALLGGASAFVLADGLLLFDRARLVLPVAMPLLTMGGAWLTVMMHRLLVEQRGRRQTEARFRQYVSPDVVDILVNNPELSSMEPQRRELSIVFSDIRGFTTLAEKLGTEGTFTLLSRYLATMTEVLQSTRATLDKYLGDGIMAFWGAPLADPDHALHAAQAALRMLEELDRLNKSGAFGDAGPLTIRIGLACGEVNVGDFGNPPAKSAYTVIGDAVNLAARLESANKQLGSTILMNERLRAGLPPSMRVRPLGRVVVVGRASAEPLFELIGDRTPRGDRTDAWIETTRALVEAFQSARLDDCPAFFERLEGEFQDRALADLYREAIVEARIAGPGVPFSGRIVLREK